MGAVMTAPDPAAVVRALVVAIGRATPAREGADR
jgi:hypothetical protein